MGKSWHPLDILFQIEHHLICMIVNARDTHGLVVIVQSPNKTCTNKTTTQGQQNLRRGRFPTSRRNAGPEVDHSTWILVSYN